MTTWPGWLRLIGVVFLVRTVLAIFLPIDLVGDESYYWEWGRNLDYGYFSKPPLIGWLMWALGALDWDTERGIRLAAATIGAGSLYFLGALTAKMAGPRDAFRVVALLASAPFALPANLILTIDSPLVFLWSAALLLVWRTRDAGKHISASDVALAAVLALGVLTKQVMLAFIPLWLIGLAMDPNRRHQLTSLRVYVIVAAPAVALLIPLWWNAQENWVTIHHTASHFGASEWSVGKAVGWLGAFLGSQWVLWGIVAVPVAITALTRRSTVDSTQRFLALWSLPALTVILLLSLKQYILPNWAAVFWLPLVIQAGLSLSDRWWRRGITINLIIQFGLVAAIVASPQLSVAKTPFDRILGWDTYAQRVARADRLIWPEREGIDTRRVIVVVGHRDWASQLAFYHPERPSVRLWQPRDEIRNQYGIWNRRQPITQSEALLVVTDERTALPPDLLARWPCVRSLGTESVASTGRPARPARLWHAQHECRNSDAPSSPEIRH
jgi:undecaprenyl-diphosphatase